MSVKEQRTEAKFELLAPAGSLASAKAAVHAGADAIYMGGPLFSARAYAESSGEDMLLSAIEYCHLHAVKVYMTLNTLLKDEELQGLSAYLEPYVKAGLDAVIVQDLGVLRFVRQHFPELPLHASTQMTVTGPYYGRLLRELGIRRIVAPRELSAEELLDLREETGLELEAFIHGALCYCYSGQCLMSSAIGGRSGNRGRCAGPCRLPYDVYDERGRKVNGPENRYVLSMKDLNTLETLPALLDAGVTSFKIEGRMKPPLYVAAVTSVYRKYLDLLLQARGLVSRAGAGSLLLADGGLGGISWNKNSHVDPADQRLLRAVFDRGGVTEGYLNQHNGAGMLALCEKPSRRIPEEALLEQVRSRFLAEDRKLPLRLSASFHVGQRPELCLQLQDRGRQFEVRVLGESPVQAAEKRPVLRDELLEKLKRFGDTPFFVQEAELVMDTSIFVPMKAVNELRRQAADELKRRILAGDN